MNIQEAQILVEEKVISRAPDCAVIEEATEEYDKCFVFYYQSKKYIESNDILDMLVGQGPVLVDKITGDIFETGSAYSTEHYVAAFEACGDPYGEPGSTIVITGWQEDANKVSATKLVKQATGAGLAEAKQIIDSVMGGNKATITVLDIDRLPDIVEELSSLGFNSKQLWHTQY
jgi:ribosomal protein L7/L12